MEVLKGERDLAPDRELSDIPELVEYEIAIVCANGQKALVSNEAEKKLAPPQGGEDAIEALVEGLLAAGLMVERVLGMNHEQFLKVGASGEVVGREAERLKLKKLTKLGFETYFSWELRDSFVRQPADRHLFSRTERYQLLESIIDNIECLAPTQLACPGNLPPVEVQKGVKAVATLKAHKVIKDIFPLHSESTRKQLLAAWPMNFLGGTSQPLDAIYSYFGAKVATYFAFLGSYTQWLVFPAAVGLYCQFANWGSLQTWLLPSYAMVVVMWAVAFLAFWKRRNTELLARWEIRLEEDEAHTRKPWDEGAGKPLYLEEVDGEEVTGPNKVLRNAEWQQRLRTAAFNSITVLGILLVQTPYEMAFMHIFHRFRESLFRFVLLVGNLVVAKRLTGLGTSVALHLNKKQRHVSKESEANGLVYKMFTISFLQSYAGFFYYAFLARDFDILRGYLFNRLVVSQIMGNVTEVVTPIVTYFLSNRSARQEQQKEKKATGEKAEKQSLPRCVKEFLMPSYAASVGDGEYDGTFDDFMELAIQFGMVTMFACAFPLAAVFALLNNVVEIRSDAFKLLATMRRPVPHEVASIGAWLAVFQSLGVIAILSNMVLLIFLYDGKRNWSIEPSLAVLLLLEHVLLLGRRALDWFIPPEPAWVKAKRQKRAKTQEFYSLELVRSVSKKRRSFLPLGEGGLDFETQAVIG